MFPATIDTVYDDEEAGQVPIPKGEILEYCFFAMLMVWSWAHLFHHDAISTPMKTALRQYSLPDIFVCDLQLPAFFQPPSPGPGTARGQCESHRAHPGIR